MRVRKSKVQDRPLARHISYCAGKGWIGSGSKDTSPCLFGDSKHIEAVRYICNHCAIGITPDQILADKNGIHLQNVGAMDINPPEFVKRPCGRPKKPIDTELSVKQIEKNPPVKRGRGRPCKPRPETTEPVVKRGRGRPKGAKNKPKVT